MVNNRSGSPASIKILEHIKRNPGVHFRRIVRNLRLAVGDVQYNIQLLEDRGMIKSLRTGLRKLYYPSQGFSVDDQRLLGALAHETQREILLNLTKTPGLSVAQLAKLLGLSPPTIFWHLKRLTEVSLVRRSGAHGHIEYFFNGDKSKLLEFMCSYHQSVWDEWSSRMEDILLSVSLKSTED
jgi:predicted transcriptional regulator